MTERSFSLMPFPESNLPDITINGKVARENNSLTIGYALTGKIDRISLPPISTELTRKTELWKTTCLEFFIAIKDLPQYWEFNLSASGDWNAYRMDAYRRIGFREETSIQRLLFDVRKDTNHCTLDAVIDLNPIVKGEEILDIGIAAIIETRDGKQSYWALAHPASQADFHLREGFILALAG